LQDLPPAADRPPHLHFRYFLSLPGKAFLGGNRNLLLNRLLHQKKAMHIRLIPHSLRFHFFTAFSFQKD